MEEGAGLLITAFTDFHLITDSMRALTQTGATGGGNNIFLDVLLIALLLLVNGFFAASEMAIVTLNDNWVRKQAEMGDKAAKKILHYIEDPGNFLATIQVGVTLAGFLSSSFGAERFAPRLAKMIMSEPTTLVSNLSLVLVTLIISYFSLVFGELVPKQVALSNPYGFSKFAVGIIRIVDVVLLPFTKFLNFSTRAVLKILRIDPNKQDQTSTEEEIRMMIDIGHDRGNIHVTEREMIVNVFDFNDKEVSEIMTHRTSVVALPSDASYEEVIDIAVHEKYSRIPVYEEDIDNVVGILHVKDLLYYMADERKEAFILNALLRPPYLVPESKHVDQLFREMQRDRLSLAIIIDEYGGTAGIVTLEDLVEELVGNIQDEYDEEDHELEMISENEYIVNGLFSLEDLEKRVHDVVFSEEDDNDYDTVAGFVLGLLDRIPDENETVSVDYRNLTFAVLQMEDKRIAKLRLTINTPLSSYTEDEERDTSNGDVDNGYSTHEPREEDSSE